MIMTGSRSDWVVLDGWLRGSAHQIYRWISMDQKEKGRRSTLNSMMDMRRGLGLDLDTAAIPDWLRYWGSLEPEQREALRRAKRAEIKDLDIPKPEGAF